MKTARHTYTSILVAAVFVATPLWSSARVNSEYSWVVDHSTDEWIDQGFFLQEEDNGEGAVIPRDTVTWEIRVTNTRGIQVGEEFSISAPADGIAKTRLYTEFQYDSSGNQTVLHRIDDTGQAVIVGVLDTGIESSKRVSYMLHVSPRRGVNPFTGEPVKFPASVRASFISSTFNPDTGQTTGQILQTIRVHTSCSQ
jgi:hypothetical protein